MRTVGTKVGLAALVLFASACGGGEPLADDEHGAEACSILGEMRAPDAPDVLKFGGLFVAGEEASQSTTPAIKAAAGSPLATGDHMVDADKLQEACESEGVEIPDAT